MFYQLNGGADEVLLILQRWNYYCKLNISSKKSNARQNLVWKRQQEIKKSKALRKKYFLFHQEILLESARNKRTDTAITAFLPRNSEGYITSKFRTN